MNTLTMILLIVAGAILVIAVTVLGLYVVKKRKIKSNSEPTALLPELSKQILTAVGGKENILEVNFKMARLIVNVKNSAIYQPEMVSNIKAMTMENKITFVIGQDAQQVCAELKALIQ